MAPPVKRNPTSADSVPAHLWAISKLKSISAGKGKVGVGIAVFDLVHLEEHRGHRLVLYARASKPKLYVGGTFTASRYMEFRTTRLVTFNDFHGVYMESKSKHAGLYEWLEVKIKESVFPTSKTLGHGKVSGKGLGIPNWGTDKGITEINYTDGKVADLAGVEYRLKPPFAPEKELEHKGAAGTMMAFRMAGDTLFAFNSHALHQAAEWTLQDAADFIRARKGPSHKIHIVGHTDNVGSDAFNINLSRNRANAVADWLIKDGVIARKDVIIVAEGESKPIEDNQLPDGADHPYGREKNRRVEILVM